MPKKAASDTLAGLSIIALFIASVSDAQPIWYLIIIQWTAIILVLGDFLIDFFEQIKRRK